MNKPFRVSESSSETCYKFGSRPPSKVETRKMIDQLKRGEVLPSGFKQIHQQVHSWGQQIFTVKLVTVYQRK